MKKRKHNKAIFLIIRKGEGNLIQNYTDGVVGVRDERKDDDDDDGISCS